MYGPMALKVHQEFPMRLALVHSLYSDYAWNAKLPSRCEMLRKQVKYCFESTVSENGGAPKEQRRRRAVVQKGVVGESISSLPLPP